MDELATFVEQALRISVPYALAALGGAISERAGVVALGLEGMLLGGAFTTTLAVHASGSTTLGVLAALCGGVVIASLYGVVALRFAADQVVTSVGVNLLVLGLTPFLLGLAFGSSASSPAIAGLGSEVLSEPLFWVVVGLVVGAWWGLGHTRFGLRLRAVGDHPDAAESVGVPVMRVRWMATLICGAMAGLGGGWLALSAAGFTDEMSGGRGYIALAAVIMGKWRPVAAVLACVFFGCVEAWQVRQQATGGLPREVLQMLPYLLTIVALSGFIGRSRAPESLGRPR